MERKESMLVRLMEKEVYHRISFVRDANNSKNDAEASLHCVMSQPSEDYTQLPLNEIQNTIMRNINQQDFEENLKINEKIQMFRINCISEKRKQADERVKESVITRLNEQRQA